MRNYQFELKSFSPFSSGEGQGVRPKPRVVSTKRLATELVEQLHNAGIELLQHNFIQTDIHVPEKIDSTAIQKYIVLTSKTAVHAWLAIANRFKIDVQNHLVFCLDQATKIEVVENKLPIEATATDASALADVILDRSEIKGITFICSDIRRDELPSKLKANSVDVKEIVGYRTSLTSIKLEEPIDSVLFFSPSGVESFVSQNSILPVCFCIGKTTARCAIQKGFQQVLVAEVASAESLVKKIIQYYSKNPVHA